jgi:5'-nucleotidase
MRWHWTLMATLAATLMLAAGCQEKKPQMAQGPSSGTAQPEPMSFDSASGPQGSAQASEGSAAAPAESGPSEAGGSSNAGSGSQPQRMDMPPGESSGPATGGERTYTVQEGDTLYSLAKRFYGNGQMWQRIADANPDISPKRLPVGEEIVVPQQ